jgi:hypothetical protein
MLSSDSESGVIDDDVLRRCAVLRIFRFAACTMLATNRDDVSFCASLLSAVGKMRAVKGDSNEKSDDHNSRSILATFSRRKSADGSSVPESLEVR